MQVDAVNAPLQVDGHSLTHSPTHHHKAGTPPPDPHQVGGERIARLVEALSCLPGEVLSRLHGESMDPHPNPPTLTLTLTRTLRP